MPGNSQRKGAVRRKGRGNTAGSGGRVRRGLEGKGPTPKAEDRPYHKAHKQKQRLQTTGGQRPRSQAPRTGRPGSGPEWVAGRNPVLEALQAGIPVQTAFVAEGADRDDRLREIMKFCADHSIPLMQATRTDLDRMTGGAIHQSVALKLPEYEYAHPDDLMAAALDSEEPPLVVMLDQITDPRNLGAIIRSVSAFSGDGVILPERRSAAVTATAWKTSAGAAARVPVSKATNLTRTLENCKKAGYFVVGLDGGGDVQLPELNLATEPLIVVVGSEGKGLSRLVTEHCDAIVSIPIDSTMESLNASMAVGITLYEVSRRRASA